MRKRALIIEDEHEIRTILAIAMEHGGEFEALTAKDGTEGISVAREVRPDVILLDVLMPGLDGYAVCRKIKEQPQLKDIPVIFITAKSDCAEAAKVAEAGGCACIAKPFDPLQLGARIESIISGVHKVDLAGAMTEFAATIAHELRTPLTSLKGSVGLILSGAAGDVSDNDRLRALLGIVARNSDRLIRLVDDMLEMARVETGNLPLRLGIVTMDACVLRAVEEARALAEERQVKMIASVKGNIPPVVVDADRIEQVVVNLLSNAIRFSPPGGTVRASVRAIRSHVEVEVSDEGPGVPDDDRERIFEKFYRGAAGAAELGTGLGLAISKSIIDRHGGRIFLRKSKRPGSSFVFTLPVPGEDELLRSPPQ